MKDGLGNQLRHFLAKTKELVGALENRSFRGEEEHLLGTVVLIRDLVNPSALFDLQLIVPRNHFDVESEFVATGIFIASEKIQVCEPMLVLFSNVNDPFTTGSSEIIVRKRQVFHRRITKSADDTQS